MQEQTLKERLKLAIQLYQETKDPRAAEVVEHINKILSTSKARKDLLQYAKHVYPGYKDPAHIQLIAKHLQQLEEGSIKRHAVFMPPRHGKSMLCSEFFPAWYLEKIGQPSVHWRKIVRKEIEPLHLVANKFDEYRKKGAIGAGKQNARTDIKGTIKVSYSTIPGNEGSSGS